MNPVIDDFKRLLVLSGEQHVDGIDDFLADEEILSNSGQEKARSECYENLINKLKVSKMRSAQEFKTTIRNGCKVCFLDKTGTASHNIPCSRLVNTNCHTWNIEFADPRWMAFSSGCVVWKGQINEIDQDGLNRYMEDNDGYVTYHPKGEQIELVFLPPFDTSQKAATLLADFNSLRNGFDIKRKSAS